jgi:hypothetical protein
MGSSGRLSEGTCDLVHTETFLWLALVLRFEAKRAELLRTLVRDAVESAISDSRPGPRIW